MFEKFYSVLTTYPSLKSVFTFYDVLLNYLIPFVCLLPVAWVYKRTHRGVTYNQSFIHTMFVMAVTTSIIMMIIGSNIARAFSLVGALSIIRFRTAIKDSRDTGYIFATIAIGMAAGTGMYLVAVTSTLLFCLMMIALNSFRIGEKLLVDKLLKVTVDKEKGEDAEKEIEKNSESFSLIHSELLEGTNNHLHTYVITSSGVDRDKALLEGLGALSSVHNASIFYNDQRIEI